MPTLEEEIRRLMTEGTAGLHAAPDLMGRVVRSTRERRRRIRIAAAAASVAACVVTTPAVAFFTVGTTPTAVERSTSTPAPEPPAIDDTPPLPSAPPSLGDLGDGREFGRMKVGYLPDGLEWSGRSADWGDTYHVSYVYRGDDKSSYRVMITVYEGSAVEEVERRITAYRDEADGEAVTVGGRSGYLVVQHVGEDGMKGTPTLFLRTSDSQWAEIGFSPVYAEEYSGAEAVDAELLRIGRGLTSTM
ncbi:hypothetical protein OIE67_32710 [Nonomuraea fuscirosea]|uniref:hypothetical protein n=1 Tax=Nonomuraea fuscirosea TaxID=1291556 RepID=UPI002DDB8E83|nr:hypothetical protein [Nonomuraea fuscirosea]WSA48832.1 hypothetical protein OIE67_32710 [Nonomuraea fuscirosea]